LHFPPSPAEINLRSTIKRCRETSASARNARGGNQMTAVLSRTVEVMMVCAAFFIVSAVVVGIL